MSVTELDTWPGMYLSYTPRAMYRRDFVPATGPWYSPHDWFSPADQPSVIIEGCVRIDPKAQLIGKILLYGEQIIYGSMRLMVPNGEYIAYPSTSKSPDEIRLEMRQRTVELNDSANKELPHV